MSLAPAFTTTLFSYSIKNSLPVFGRNVVYVVLISLSCVSAAHSLSLSERDRNTMVQHRRDSSSEELPVDEEVQSLE